MKGDRWVIAKWLLVACLHANAAEPSYHELGAIRIAKTSPLPLVLVGRTSTAATYWLDFTPPKKLELTIVPAGSNATVVVTDGLGRILHQSVLSGSKPSTFWIPTAEKAPLVVEISGGDPTKSTARITRWAGAENGPKALGQIGDPDFKFVDEVELSTIERELADRVAFVRFFAGGVWAMCSGFALSDGILVTNKHCVTKQNCGSAEIVFDWETDNRPTSIWATCTGVRTGAFYPPSMDVAVLTIAPRAGFGPLPTFSPMKIREPTTGEEVFVVQHPGNAVKQIVRDNCAVSKVGLDATKDGARIAEHTCDTRGGSSGSPLVAKDGALVGVHYWGTYDGKNGRNKSVISTVLLPAK